MLLARPFCAATRIPTEHLLRQQIFLKLSNRRKTKKINTKQVTKRKKGNTPSLVSLNFDGGQRLTILLFYLLHVFRSIIG